MKKRIKQSGLSLMEMTIVVAVAATLAVLSMPAIRSFVGSSSSISDAKLIVSGAMASAKAIAAREQSYAGLRFQQDAGGNQYVVFIVHDPTLEDFDTSSELYSKAEGFKALKGVRPIRLPENALVTDMMVGDKNIPEDFLISDDINIDESYEVLDATTFTIVFSPAGKLVIREAAVLREGSSDEIFNEPAGGVEFMFEDDYYGSAGSTPYQQEVSRNSFVVFEKDRFNQALATGQAYTGYLQRQAAEYAEYINAYTGTIVVK